MARTSTEKPVQVGTFWSRIRHLASHGVILEAMTTSPRPRRHLAGSPFQPDPEPTIEQYAVADMVSHDAYGMGRVTTVESAAVTVDFGSQTVRIPSPFHKMSKL